MSSPEDAAAREAGRDGEGETWLPVIDECRNWRTSRTQELKAVLEDVKQLVPAE